MFRLSPFILAALLVALGLSSCTKHHDASPAPAPAPAPKDPKAVPPGPVNAGVQFYDNSEIPVIYKLIDGALTSIDIEIYEMSDADVLTALQTALARGVKIRVIKEPKPGGDSCDVFAQDAADHSDGCTAERALRAAILAAGGSYVPYAKQALCADPSKPCVQHGKLLVADGKIALVSSGNFNSTNLCNRRQKPKRCDRDYSVTTTDSETLSFLSSIFENDLKSESYDLNSLFTDSLRAKITVSPLSLPPILALIRSANTSIRLENQYLEDRDMNDALMAAARRGVHVEVTTASACAYGAPSATARAKATETYSALELSGIDVRMLPAQFQVGGLNGYLHAKALTIDGVNAWVGSVNGSTPALSNNREFGLIFSNPDSVSALDKLLSTDHASPDMETWGESLDCRKDKT